MMAVAVVVVAAAVAVLVDGPWWVWCGASAGVGAPALYQRLVMVDGSSSYEVHNIFTCLQATNRGKSRKMVIAGEKNTPTTNTWTDKFRRFFCCSLVHSLVCRFVWVEQLKTTTTQLPDEEVRSP